MRGGREEGRGGNGKNGKRMEKGREGGTNPGRGNMDIGGTEETRERERKDTEGGRGNEGGKRL